MVVAAVVVGGDVDFVNEEVWLTVLGVRCEPCTESRLCDNNKGLKIHQVLGSIFSLLSALWHYAVGGAGGLE